MEHSSTYWEWANKEAKESKGLSVAMQTFLIGAGIVTLLVLGFAL